MERPPMTVTALEEMLRSIPGESWALVGGDGRLLYAVGPDDGVLAGAQVAGEHLAALAHPDDLPTVLRALHEVLERPGIAVRLLTRVIHGEGWRVHEVTAVNRLHDPAIGAIVVRTRAVTEGPAFSDDTSLIGSLAEAVPTPILVADPTGDVVFANAAARELLGDDLHDVVRRLHGQEATATIAVRDRWVQARKATRAEGWVAMLDDITLQHHRAMRDPLTGVANRAAFDEHLRAVLASPSDRAVSVIFVDLDDFKLVNDRHGHAEGDRVLREVGARLLHEVRPDDLVARLGGDEFAVICEGLDAHDASRLAGRLAETAGAAASAGAATTPPLARDPAALVAAADRAMYEQKT